ncbi:MAG: nitroreductase/quinone reductase family protein [Acidimicrobiia bacterium]
MADESNKPGWLPPKWFRRAAWKVHRSLYRITGGRLGLWRPKPQGWGALRLTAIGRRSGQKRSVILGYFEDGPDYVTLAMNGWIEGEPAWWLNLQANPEAAVAVKGGESQRIRARAAEGEERDRLWARWKEIEDDLDGWAAQRSTKAAVVVLQVLGVK